MKKKLYTLSILSTVFGCMSHAYATAVVQDDVEANAPQAVAASSQPSMFANWIMEVRNNTASAKTNMSRFQTNPTMIQDLANALATNTTVTELDLRNCLIGSESALILINTLHENNTLEKLDLRQNPIEGYFLGKLQEVADTHPTLKTIKYGSMFHEIVDGCMEGYEGVDLARKLAKSRFEDLLANRQKTVQAITLKSDDRLDLDQIEDDMAFPRLTNVNVDFPMDLRPFEGFVMLMGMSPRLEKFSLKSADLRGLSEDNEQNKRVGYEFLDLVGNNHALKSVKLRANTDGDKTLFDGTDPVFIQKLRQVLHTHPSLESLDIHVPAFNLRFVRHLSKDPHVAADNAFYFSRVDAQGMRDMSFALENRLVNGLAFNFHNAGIERDMPSMLRFLAQHPVARLTVEVPKKERVDAGSLNLFMHALKRYPTDFELGFKMPPAMLPKAVEFIGSFVPRVLNVSYNYHESLDNPEFHEMVRHITGRKSLVERLLGALDEGQGARLAAQRRVL
ncbi:MAG: hypothetical protein C0514_03275 [Candidatus Puniceispirillum sp.]|nr:hypothetical protein [Candidatus Puniceispirillum sp.]